MGNMFENPPADAGNRGSDPTLHEVFSSRYTPVMNSGLQIRHSKRSPITVII